MSKLQVIPSLNQEIFERLQKRCQIRLTPKESQKILQEINDVVLPSLHQLNEFDDLSKKPVQSFPEFTSIVHFRPDISRPTSRAFFWKNADLKLSPENFIIVSSHEKT